MAPSLLSQLLGMQKVLAVDIGSHSIKAVEAMARKEQTEITALGSVLTPPGAMENGVVVDRAAVAGAITDLVHSIGADATVAAATATDPSLVATRIQMPRSLQKSLHKSIRFEARKHIPFDIDQSLVECQVLDPDDRDSDQMTVLLVAVRSEVVTSRVETLEMARLDTVYVDVEQFASMRACVYASQDPRVFQETLALIRIGSSFTEMAMLREGAFVFPRIIPIAGATIDRAIASAMNIDQNEARELKEQRSAACRRDDMASLGDQERQVSQIAAPALEEITRDIQRSFVFLATQLSMDPSTSVVDRVLLSGGTAAMRNVGPYLEDQLGVPVQVPNVFTDAAITMRDVDPEYAAAFAPAMSAAVGLALRDAIRSGRYPMAGVPARHPALQAAEPA
jgi:type IV pilus assembly protein PilM